MKTALLAGRRRRHRRHLIVSAVCYYLVLSATVTSLLLQATPVCAVHVGEASKDLNSTQLLRGGSNWTTQQLNRSSTTIISVPLIPHHVRFPNSTIQDNVRHRRRRRLGSSSSSSSSLSFSQVDALYQGYGTHYVDLWVGTPNPQRETLIVDTGSAVTAFPCERCKHKCGDGHHTDNHFQESKSRTFEVVECKDCKIGRCSKHHDACVLSAMYQEGSSWKAFEASDVVYSGGPHHGPLKKNRNSFRMRFGCQTHLNGLFNRQLADGILGMEIASSSLWHQMWKQSVMDEKSFALCLAQQPTASREGTRAGAMTLGGADTRLHATPMVYANQLNDKGWFVVRLKRLFLRMHGGESVEVPQEDERYVRYMEVGVSEASLNNGIHGQVVLDSGTTDTYLSYDVYENFNKVWKSMMPHGRSYDNGSHSYSKDELLSLPTILFQLEAYNKDDGDPRTTPGLVGKLDDERPTDVLVSMPPTHYMEYNPNTKRYSSRLYFNEKHGGGSVLGANFMMGHDVLFDAHRGRIGFAESKCDYTEAAV